MKKLFIPIFLLLITIPCTAESLLGGESVFLGIGYLQENLASSELDYLLKSSGMLTYNGDFLELDSEIAIFYENESIEWSLENFLLSLYPCDFMDIKMGRYPYLPGAAEFFSTTNFFSRMDMVNLLNNGADAFLLPADLIQTGIYLDNSYCIFSLSPFKQEMSIPDPASIWFPMAMFPQLVTVPPTFMPSHDLSLGEIILLEGDSEPDLLSDTGLSVEWGAFFDYFDLSLQYYYGWDYSLQMSSTIDPLDLVDTFNIELSPVYSRIHAFGTNLEMSIDDFRLYGDSSLILNKRLLTEEVSIETLETQTVNGTYLNYCIGMTYQLSGVGLHWLLEYKDDCILSIEDSETEVISPFLHSVVSGLMRYSPSGLNFSADLLGFLSLSDMSWVAALQLNYFAVDQIKLSLYMPWFFGEYDTELGQFKDNSIFALSLSCYY